ncbi:MAG TPA: HlyD family efflux transporter periplasmic adaptor subunit [Caldilineaceae bacterium]|nr:HlyD family efflux transporter periplasmic adaptor subunit [Caldilineaceae bacterium]
MVRWFIGIIVVVLLLAGGFYAYQAGYLPTGASNEATMVTESGAAATLSSDEDVSVVAPDVVADARLLPVQRANLSLAVSGIIDEVLVQEGDVVTAGQLLVRLRANQQQAAVAQAQATLLRAEAQLRQLTAPPRSQEIAAAEATLQAASARYERLAEAALPGDIAAAEAAVNASQASLAKVLEGTSEQQLIAARADLANAEAVLRQAQRAYDRVKWSNEIGALPESAALQQATNNFEAAQARLADLQSGPSQADVANASAQVRRAQAQLDTLRAAMPADLVAAEADVQGAQAQLDLLLAGAREEAVAVAQAEIAAATSGLQQALVALGETELRAPFAGTVAEVMIETGEQAAPGNVLIRLADLTHWEVETEDLTEFDIVGLTSGDQVMLEFDAIPDLAMDGTVKRIRPIGEDNRGDIVYTVVIEPTAMDPRFLWNMTAAVTLAR